MVDSADVGFALPPADARHAHPSGDGNRSARGGVTVTVLDRRERAEIEALQLAYLATDRAINTAMAEGREGVLELVAERDRLRERWRRLSQSTGPGGPAGEFSPRA